MRIVAGLIVVLGLASCGPSQKPLFSKKTGHEKYSDGIEQAGLKRTQLGSKWVAAAVKSLNQPVAVNLPYQETGYFPAEEPRAAGYVFNAKEGEKLIIKVQKKPSAEALVFTELYLPSDQHLQQTLLATVDTLTNTLEYNVEKDGKYLVRVQPELLRSVEYTLSIQTAPSLAFPVKKSDKPTVISFWGADRDKGIRKHEGIDIQAKFRTPVVAVADGYVNSVGENNLGGKVIFMRAADKNYNVYYAHLDSQLVEQGDRVKMGDTLGLIGNTGNAKFTVPHLHFGIYRNGAIDPYPFVNSLRAEPKKVSVPLDYINQDVRTLASTNIYSEDETSAAVVTKAHKGAALRVLAASGSFYKVSMPDDQQGFVSGKQLTTSSLQKITLNGERRLLDEPNADSAAKMTLEKGTRVEVTGIYNDYYLVSYNKTTGWISK